MTWLGRSEKTGRHAEYAQEVEEELSQFPAVIDRWQWLHETQDVADVLARHHVLLHPSFHEGLPNVICEAFAAAKPVVASNVCDHPMLVGRGRRGLLFDPAQPEDLADALIKIAGLSPGEWATMVESAESYARTELSIERMVTQFEALLGKRKNAQHLND